MDEQAQDRREQDRRVAEEQIAKMQATIDHYSATIAELRAECVEWANASLGVEVYVTGLRDAIAAWPVQLHTESCDWVRYSPRMRCYCGADDTNAARAHARRVAGLEG
jgi:hypothetical protein